MFKFRLKLFFVPVLFGLLVLSCKDSGSGDEVTTSGSFVTGVLTSVSSSAAMISWIKADSETSWTVEYGASGFQVGSGTSGTDAAAKGSLGVSNISGLSANTTYDAYITPSGSSESVKTTFTTLAADASVFAISLSDTTCTVDIETELGVTSSYSESVSGTTRTISVNGIPSHKIGIFPTDSTVRRIGNPNDIAVTNKDFTVTTTPSKETSYTSGKQYTNGVLFSGSVIEVYTAERFTGFTGQTNDSWTRTAVQSLDDLGVDCNNAHVQPTGQYHYHGLPNAYAADSSITGDRMWKIGYAADGFPIYYLYYDNGSGTILEASASYELKSGTRGGNGITAPSGAYDGEYFEDYVYDASSGDLDECNGRTGPTPDVPTGEYYYVVTKDFPSFPICFYGTPNSSFATGSGPPSGQ